MNTLPLRMPINAILFDLDDTLYDRRSAFLRWTQQYVADHFPTLTHMQQDEMVGHIIALDANGYGSKAAIFEKLHADLVAEGRSTATPDTFYDQFFTHLFLEDEVKELLSWLQTVPIPFGVVTNGAQRQWQKIQRLALDNWTQCLFVSDDFGCKKPDARIFLAAAARLGVAPDSILFVGDHPVNDIEGAFRVGMHTAWLHRNQPWPDDLSHLTPHYTLSTLGELRSILAQLS